MPRTARAYGVFCILAVVPGRTLNIKALSVLATKVDGLAKRPGEFPFSAISEERILYLSCDRRTRSVEGINRWCAYRGHCAWQQGDFLLSRNSAWRRTSARNCCHPTNPGLSGPYSQDNKPSSLRWCPVAQLTGAAPVLSVVLRSTNLSTILAPPPLAVW